MTTTQARTVLRHRALLPGGWSLSEVTVRALLGVLGLAALLLPMYRHSGPAVIVLVLSVLPLLGAVVRPDGPWVGFVMAGSLVDWLAGSLLSGSFAPVMVLAYALVLFWLHRVGSLAAVMPRGVELDLLAARRVVVRTVAVSVVSLPVMAVLLAIRPRTHGSFPLALVGGAATVGVLLVVALSLHRRGRG